VGGGRWSVDHGFSTRMGKLADLLSGEGTLTDVVLEGRALFSVGQVGRLMGDADGGRWAVDGGRWAVDGGGSRAETEHRNVRPLWEHPARERLLRLERELERGTFVSHAEMMTYMHDTLLRDTERDRRAVRRALGARPLVAGALLGMTRVHFGVRCASTALLCMGGGG
jgi:hypothetical protein